MTPHLRKTVLFALLVLALSPSNGPAKDMRFPEQGAPAYAFVLPDDWIPKPDGEGNLIMANPNRTAVIVLFLQDGNDELDKVANDGLALAKATVWHRKEPAEISGCKGFTYFSTIKNPKGIDLNMELTLVRVDSKHIGWRTLLLMPDVPKVDETAARLVCNGVKLVTE